MKIHRRKPGEWVIDFTLNKKRVRRVIKGSRRMAEQAATFEKERIYKQKYQIPEPKKKIRFEEYSELYRENYTKEKRSRKNEEYVLGQLNRYFKGKFLNDITAGDVERFKTQGKKKGLKNATINRQLIVLRAMINIAIDSEDYGIFRNPVTKAGRLKEDSHRERFLTPDEMSRLIDTAELNPWGGHLPLFLTVALNTGMRKMEILSLRWSEVDFENRTITVTRERAKSKKERHVPMNDVVVDALQKAERESEFVFYNPKTKSHIKHVRTTFKRACKDAKLKNLRVHDLRHTAASFLVNDCGVSIAVASEILGHSKLEMTMKYVHSTPEHRQLGVERLGEIFKKSRKKTFVHEKLVEIEKPLINIISHH